MSSNPYKAFIPYTIHPAVCSAPALRMVDPITPHLSIDPSGGAWRTIGLVKGIEGDLVHDLDNAGHVVTVQFNERILPGKVRDEKVSQRKAKLEEMEGRKLTKKEYAELREEIELDLLPKAFIRRTQVPVFFTHPDLMFVCTSSQKRADDTVSFLCSLFDHLAPVKMSVVRGIPECLTTLAKGNWTEEDGDRWFEAATSAVLKGDEKRTVRIKDRDIGGAEVQDLLKTTNYQVTEIGINAYDGSNSEPEAQGDQLLSFTLNDNLTFKRCTLPDVKASQHKDDAHGFAWISLRTYRMVLADVLHHLGGRQQHPVDNDSANDSANDDEEL